MGDIGAEHEFDWIVLQPGLLHIEMNSCKSFIGLHWEVFGEDVFVVLDFKSTNAFNYAKRCSDHHKTWQIIEALYTALADELLVPFICCAK